MKNDFEKLKIFDIFSSILDALPGHIAILDETGRIVMVNRAWRQFAYENSLKTGNFGIGQNYLDICENAGGDCETDAFLALDAIRSLLENKNDFSAFEYPCHSPVCQRWFRFMATKLVGEYMSGVVVIHYDITARKLVEDALRASEERFRLLCKATNDAIWDWDLVNDKVWWSDGFAELFGYDMQLEDPSIESWANRIHPKDRDTIVAEVFDVVENFSGTDHWSCEYRYQRADGTFAYVVDRRYVIRDKDGRALRIIGGMTDLTERKLVEERLTQQAALIDHASDAIIVRDLKNKILFWNRRAEQIYEWRSEEVLQKQVKDILYQNNEPLDKATDEVISKGKWTGELTHKTKSGQLRTMLCRWNLLYDEEGLPKSILAINTDITERKKVEEQFMRAQRLESIGVLAGGIAHDLNNVLSPIIMSLDILNNEIESVDGKQILNTLKISAERGADLIKQVLGFARGVEGERLPVNITNICHDIQKVIRETFPKNILFELNIPDELWTIIADPTQLHQVIMNMCVNARDAMPDGGKLSITIENIVLDEVFSEMTVQTRPGPYVLIKIEDNGYGMPKEVREKIFEPFFTTKDIGKGTGLGLSTTFSIVRDHGGFINVYSEPGNGTRFKLYFPANTDTNLVAESAKINISKLPLGNGEVILLVDDEESIRNISKRTLERFGYRVMLAQHGAEAISLYAIHRDEIDVVLTDMSMPVMDGLALIVALKSIAPDVNIIASSGLGANGYMLKVMQSGVKHFVHKPYTTEALLKVLNEILHKIEPNCTTANTEHIHNHDMSLLNSEHTDRDDSVDTIHNNTESLIPINCEKILVVDDNAAMRTVAKRALEKNGFTVLIAVDAKEALNILEDHADTIHMIFTDVHMPGMSGIDLIQEVARKYPDIKRVLVSGDNNSHLQDNSIQIEYYVIDKPYTISNLINRVRDILDE